MSNNIFLADPGYCNSCILSPALQPVVSGSLLVTYYIDWYFYKIQKFFLDRKPSAVKNRRINPATYWQWLKIMVKNKIFITDTMVWWAWQSGHCGSQPNLHYYVKKNIYQHNGFISSFLTILQCYCQPFNFTIYSIKALYCSMNCNGSKKKTILLVLLSLSTR